MSAVRTYVGHLRALAGQHGEASTGKGGDTAALDADLAKRDVSSSWRGAIGCAEDPAPLQQGGAATTTAAADAPRPGIGRLRAFADSDIHAAASDSAYDDLLEGKHAPTVRVVHELRQARYSLMRAASPELGLSPAIRALKRTEQRLRRPLRVAICGEINAGKSSLANLLAGIESLPTAVTLSTLIPTLLYYADEPQIWAVEPGGRRERLRSDGRLPRDEALRIEVGLPSQRLAAVQVLDLPGFTGARWGAPAVDLIAHHVDATIWCTVSTQAWKESERSAWSMLSPRLSARSLLVATHSDLLHKPGDRHSLLARLNEEVGASFNGIIPLATLDAIALMSNGHRDSAAWAASGAEALEAALAALLVSVREQRAGAAQAVTGRIASRALARLESHFGPETP